MATVRFGIFWDKYVGTPKPTLETLTFVAMEGRYIIDPSRTIGGTKGPTVLLRGGENGSTVNGRRASTRTDPCQVPDGGL